MILRSIISVEWVGVKMHDSRHGSRLGAALFGLLLCLAGPATAAMYDIKPDEIPGKPGTIIRVYPLEGGGAGVVGKGNAFRVVYRSTGLNNKPIAVSGAIFIPAGAPVFIAQGSADTTVRPEITKRFGEALCKQGAQVSFINLPGVTHTFAAKDSAAAALQWMTDRFRGLPAHSDCE